jgi:hypothetical protein
MLNEIVRQLGELNFEGNIIPHNWFKHPALQLPKGKRSKGKVNLNAVVILAEVCYWYRPQVILDEGTGQVIEVRNRFKGDALQRTYEALGAKFGLTKLQAQRACYFLRDRGVLVIERRAVAVEGTMVGNVTFFTPVVEKVRELNGADALRTSKSQGINSKVRRVATSKSNPRDLKVASSLENRRETRKEIEPPSQKDLEEALSYGVKFRGEAGE